MRKLILAAMVFAATSAFATNVLDLAANKVGAPVQGTMYGIFFEDINYGADGGLYGELVKNRSFEFPQSLMGWSSFGKVEVRDDGPFERCPHYVRLSPASHGEKRTGLDNEGYFGIGVEQGKQYRFSVWARVPDGGESRLKVELINVRAESGRQELCRENVVVSGSEWKKYSVVITPNRTDSHALLRIYLRGTVATDVEHVSLFPVDTFNGHENGMRKDLAEALQQLHPGVFRFPGGCIVEGTELYDRYQWKNSVGPVENRPLNGNRWQFTFESHFYPDYYQSLGLGFYEYFLLSEEIGAEPLPVINCGLVCQYQNNDLLAHQPSDQLDEFIQDAVDLIEFANGDTSTTWGKLRAEMGHPAPFGMKFLAVGNEQWGPEYVERLEPFLKVLRAKHPEIKIIGTSGPDSEGEKFDYLWPEMTRVKADLVDEHFYRNEKWFLSQGARYDSYSRKGPKVFAGEYACHGDKKGWNHFHAALCEAAFMTGLERNADVVHMATYAPLFAHVDGWQWRPDMIWFDNLGVVRTASYYVQQLYSHYKGTNVLPLTMQG
ncbi:MAG: carbohydrate binding domain-containing protein, partial [Muribaculaceae bacterium]|nr:carbohydrate binding domain-containing protein [Muribaculaceae bacterium]